MTRVLVLNGTDGRVRPQPFGAQALERHGFELLGPGRGRIPRKLVEVVHHRSQVLLDRPGWRAAHHADLVLAYLEPNLAWPARARRMPMGPFRRVPLVGIVCWAAEDLGDPRATDRVRRLLLACDLVGYWSHNQTAVFAAHGIPEERLVPLTFGVDLDRLGPAPGPDAERDLDVVAVGQDRGRDYPTLVAAADGAGWTVDVVAPREALPAGDLPEQVRHRGRLGFADYVELLRRARVCVVPTHLLAYPTGQTVALEAAALGCAVVVTDTPAMRDYFSPGETALMPAPGAVAALRADVDRLLADDPLRRRVAGAGQERVRTVYADPRMWDELAAAIRARGLG